MYEKFIKKVDLFSSHLINALTSILIGTCLVITCIKLYRNDKDNATKPLFALNQFNNISMQEGTKCNYVYITGNRATMVMGKRYIT